jgi:hypothetical protein
MPRYINNSPATTAQKIQRARDYRVSGYKGFLDPFPLGFGTLPEKIVYFELSKRAIPFYYLNDIELTIPEIGFDQFFQADFILPTLKIIIEVQGAHWHSMPKTIDEDAFKFALYQQDGWLPLAWWDFDILDNVNKLFDQVPALISASSYNTNGNSTELTPVRRTKTDSSKGIRTVNQRRGQRLQYRKKAASIKTKKRGKTSGYSIAIK